MRRAKGSRTGEKGNHAIPVSALRLPKEQLKRRVSMAGAFSFVGIDENN
jgi:hypothetical protein